MLELHNRRLYNIDKTIIEEGQVASHIYIIQSGSVEVSKLDENGEKKVLAILGKGRVFGEMAIISQSPRKATVTAIKPTVTVEIESDRLLEALRVSPIVVSVLLKALVYNLRNAQKNSGKGSIGLAI